MAILSSSYVFVYVVSTSHAIVTSSKSWRQLFLAPKLVTSNVISLGKSNCSLVESLVLFDSEVNPL